MLFHPLIQIAGIRDAGEAQMVLKAGATHIGFPLRLNYHRPDLSEEEAKRLIAELDIRTKSVLITYLTSAEEILDFVSYLGVSTVQLHADLPLTEVVKLKAWSSEMVIFKSLIVHSENENSLKECLRDFSPYVDCFITDTFDPATGASGATGKTHDWKVSAELVKASPRPVILAGGLTPANVKDAICAVRPAGVDAHTGVEEPSGRKSAELVSRFVTEARAAFGLKSK